MVLHLYRPDPTKINIFTPLRLKHSKSSILNQISSFFLQLSGFLVLYHYLQSIFHIINPRNDSQSLEFGEKNWVFFKFEFFDWNLLLMILMLTKLIICWKPSVIRLWELETFKKIQETWNYLHELMLFSVLMIFARDYMIWNTFTL